MRKALIAIICLSALLLNSCSMHYDGNMKTAGKELELVDLNSATENDVMKEDTNKQKNEPSSVKYVEYTVDMKDGFVRTIKQPKNNVTVCFDKNTKYEDLLFEKDVINNEKSLEELMTVEYDEAQFGKLFSRSIEEVDSYQIRSFFYMLYDFKAGQNGMSDSEILTHYSLPPVRFLRKFTDNTSYTVYKTRQGGLLYAFFTENLLTHSIYSKEKISYADIADIKIGDDISVLTSRIPSVKTRMEYSEDLLDKPRVDYSEYIPDESRADYSKDQLDSENGNYICQIGVLLTDGLVFFSVTKDESGNTSIVDIEYKTDYLKNYYRANLYYGINDKDRW